MITLKASSAASTADTPVRDLVERPPVFVRGELTLRQVAEVLDGETIGVVLVRSPRGFSGLVSERDLVRALADGADPDLERADGVMTDDVLLVGPDAPLSEVRDLMLEHQVRHLPVSDGGAIIGVVSLRDVVKTLHSA
ncbi:MAG: CBS domain-containing protein [Actinobacteria bacterium]|nr:CBS domain-containing protein [Actinomycetota bacterium]